MSVEKSELRAAGMHEIGMRMDDLLAAAEQEVLRCEGASVALLQANKAIGDLNAHVDLDVTEGKYDLEAAKLVKLYLSRAAQAVQNLGMLANNQRIASAGQVQAFKISVQVTKKMHDSEISKLESVAAAESEPARDIRSRQAGMRPAPTIKEQRLAEEAKPNGKTNGKRGRRAPHA